MPTLHLGVIDVPYVDNSPAPRPRKAGPGLKRVHKRHRKNYVNKTTGDVAEILEAKYHVMEHFSVLHADLITDAIGDSLQGAIESLMAGAPPALDPFGTGLSKIEDEFKQMLSTMELDALGYPGIPTKAAQEGVSHRFANPRFRRVKGKGLVPRSPRPSFIDTGLYQASMKAWVD